MMRFFTCIIFILCTVLFWGGETASAHLGGGPPFLKINGKYSQTNPYIQQVLTSINMAQDLGPENYLVDQKLTFEVDTSQLLFPADVIKEMEFRWYFTEDLKLFKTGSSVDHSFSTIGSQLVTLMVKAPGQEEFIVLNSVQVNILPSRSYKTPKTTIQISTNSDRSDEPVEFKANTTVDSEARVKEQQWIIGDETILRGNSICYTFDSPNLFTEIDLRTTDTKGFYEDVSFMVNGTDNILKFIPAVSKKNFPVTVTNSQKSFFDFSCVSPKTIILRLLIVSVSVTVILIIVTFFVLRRKKVS